MDRDYKPLDIVKTKAGTIALVTEVSDKKCSVSFITEPTCYDYNAWHDFEELEYLNNIPSLLANGLAHPMGLNGDCGSIHFPGVK